MDESTGRKAVEMFVYLASGAKTVEFTYTGGEPLTAFPTLVVLTDYARQRASEAGMESSFVLKTNGTILDSDIVDFLRDHPVKVVLSIDGARQTHDRHRRTASGHETHSAVQRNLLALLQNDVPCVASMTIHPSESARVSEGIRFLHSLGAARIDVGPAYGTVAWTEEQVEQFASSLIDAATYVHEVARAGDQLNVGPFYRESEHVGGILSDRWGCHAASTHLAFLPNGTICGCSALAMIIDRVPELILGDVRRGLEQEAVDRMLSLAQATAEKRRACQNCETKANCTGGCLAINYATTGSPLVPPYLYCNTISVIPLAWQKAWE